MTARDIMTAHPVVLRRDQSVQEALKVIAAHRLHDLPVVDGEGRVVGMLSTFDLVRQALPAYIVSGDLKDVAFAPDLSMTYRRLEEIGNRSVAEVMTTDFDRVAPETSLLEVATLLYRHGHRAHNVAVADKEGRLLGVIGIWDIFKQMGSLREIPYGGSR
ncbi:MAG: CBS domain-containing protein [Nitrospirae bacterium]|nr:CBS domain-containing protein [Nitrospirota bacterium]